MFQEYFRRGKGDRYIGTTKIPLSYADFLDIWETQTPGDFTACPGLYRDCFASLYILTFICGDKELLGTDNPSSTQPTPVLYYVI
jgi:hypothetical protein